MQQTLFLKYLKNAQHPNVAILKDAMVSLVEMQWRTDYNIHDSGVFAMRHMETYNGNLEKFDAGFAMEGTEQHAQLENLRQKYLAKILLSELNDNKQIVEEKLKISKVRPPNKVL